MSESKHTPDNCPYCETQMVNCGAPIWEDYCPNKECTGHRDEFAKELARAHKEFVRSQRIRDAAPDMLAALKAAEELYQTGLIAASNELVENVKNLRRAAIARAEGKEEA